jgi:alpha-L-rhamnosidase
MAKRLLLLIIVIGLFASCNQPDLATYDLRCENRVDPKGIDTSQPRFSWKIRSDVRGERQTAFRILVATSEKLLAEDHADLWDSGLTKSEQSVLVPYGGQPLASGVPIVWKVQITGNSGKPSRWSETASFTVGLLDADDWFGDYIGFPADAGDPQCPLLRKIFDLDNQPARALLHINSLGYHEVYINGADAGNEPLSPAVSQFDKRSLARTVDVTDLLRAGRNEIVIWTARGWYQSHLPGCVYSGPLVRAQIETWDAGDRNRLLTTDTTWLASESGYALTSKWRYSNFGGERINAALAPANFSPEELDRRKWTTAVKVEVPPHTVSPQAVEGNILADTFKPVSISQITDSVWLVDMGSTLTGWTELKFPKLEAGSQIRLAYSDHLKDNGDWADQKQEDIYIASGADSEIFRNRFNYHSFRYIKISGLAQQPVSENITSRLIRTGYDNAAEFECSDADMNAIHGIVRHALHCLSLSGYLVDCHHFERLGYGGDGHASTLTAQTMFNLSSFYSNWLHAWEDCIRPDGGLPHTAPNPYSAGGGPYWCAFIVAAPWNTYLNYGDISVLERYYPVMRHWLEYVDAYTTDGLLHRWLDTDYRSWYLGDWATPVGVDQTNDASINLVDNCVMSECYTMLTKIALLLGHPADAADYQKRKAALNAKINAEFFHADSVSYATGSQIDNIYPLLTGVVPQEIRESVAARIFSDTETIKGGHIATGLVGLPVMVDWAVADNHPDFIYQMLKKRDYPGYLYMLDRGATATWEHWNGERSHIHNCYNGIGAWFYQAIGGLRPDESEPGYRRFTVSPQIPEGITWAKTTKETPYGTIIVRWEKTGDGVSFDLTVPVGATAEVSVAGSKADPVIVSSGKHNFTVLK